MAGRAASALAIERPDSHVRLPNHRTLRMTRANDLLTKLGRPLNEDRELNCDHHTFHVSVRYADGQPSRRADLIAGLLIVLAEYTDGFCAVRGARASDIVTPGMRFQFTSRETAVKFAQRIKKYLHQDHVAARLSVSPPL